MPKVLNLPLTFNHKNIGTVFNNTNHFFKLYLYYFFPIKGISKGLLYVCLSFLFTFFSNAHEKQIQKIHKQSKSIAKREKHLKVKIIKCI